jgi:FkbM family methyltransferase
MKPKSFRRLKRFFGRNPDRFLHGVSGVIHVGANTGQERDLYKKHRLRVLWIEPIPEVFQTLRSNLTGYPWQRALEYLITDKDGSEYTFRIANNGGLSSSIYDLKWHRDIWPEVKFHKTIALRSTTLKSLVQKEQINLDQYDALILDTQGSELLVLRGADEILDAFAFIKTEVPDFESYSGCCQLGDIDRFLKLHGFKEFSRQKFAERAEGGSYYDIVYKNTRWCKRRAIVKSEGILKPLIGEINLGRLDYLVKPELRDSWGGPFNGQEYRCRIFLDLLEQLSFQVIVETGTFRGTTTALFAQTSLPVYTVEADPRLFGYSAMRFKGAKVHIYQRDSRSFLRQLAQENTFPKESGFFYLDAHWGEDIPLREEVEIIFSNWQRSVVMIDDFEVPGSAYGFDDYGPGRALNVTYLDAVINRLGISVFFPKADISQETGAKRGCVVLCREKEVAEKLERVDTLQRDASYPRVLACDVGAVKPE